MESGTAAIGRCNQKGCICSWFGHQRDTQFLPVPQKKLIIIIIINSTLLRLLLCNGGVSAANDDLEEWLHISTSLFTPLSPARATTGR